MIVERARQVINAALGEERESHERWEHVVSLHKRGDRESFDAAAELLHSNDPDRRELGADILAQLGAVGVPVEQRPFARPAFELLLNLIAYETHPEVLESVATAFGHLADPRGSPALRLLSEHPDEKVRHAVVFGLLGQDDDLAIQTLVELSEDPEPSVRDWATFGLGTQTQRDDPQIRGALLARLDDPDDNARGEALRGLAARGDELAIPQLLIELDDLADREDPSILEEALLDLAAKTGDPRLCRHVEDAGRRGALACPGEAMREDLRDGRDAVANAPRSGTSE